MAALQTTPIEPDTGATEHRLMSVRGVAHLPFRNFIHLTEQEAYTLMSQMLSGEMETAEIAGILSFLRGKGETVAELVGFARALRDLSQPLEIDQSADPVLDTCGTGGDGASTFNISTTTAFVVAGAGLRVAKHGNRRISSQCGSSEVLEALGVPASLSLDQVGECIREVGIGFLYAPLLHPAVKVAHEARLMLKGRTIFNLLGPLTNPVQARVRLIGAYSVRAAELLAQACVRLGVDRAFVVHGADGLDEITVTSQTTVFQVEEGGVQKGQWTAGDFGVGTATLADLEGGSPDVNASIVRSVLQGLPGAHRDVVVANAAAALLAARKTPDLKSAVAAADESIDSGAARGKLEQLVEFAGKLATVGSSNETI